jgi:16S rRNA processing protein RimM
MERSEPSFLVVGHLNKPHGMKGELFVWPLTDHPEGTFAPGVVLYLGDESGNRPDPDRPTVRVEGARPFRRGYLLSLEGVGDRTQAELLQGRYVLRPLEELDQLEDDEVFYHQLLGLKVQTRDGRELGEVVEVYEIRPADLLEVRGDGATHFIPFLKSFIHDLDMEKGILTVDPPEGLLDL